MCREVLEHARALYNGAVCDLAARRIAEEIGADAQRVVEPGEWVVVVAPSGGQVLDGDWSDLALRPLALSGEFGDITRTILGDEELAGIVERSAELIPIWISFEAERMRVMIYVPRIERGAPS